MPGVKGSPSMAGAFMTSTVRSMMQVPPTRVVGSLALRVIAGPVNFTSPVAGDVWAIAYVWPAQSVPARPVPVAPTAKTPGSGVGQGGMAPPGREPHEGVKVMASFGMEILPSVGSERLVREMKTPTPFAPTVVEVGIVGPMASRAPLTGCAPAEATSVAEKSRVATV